MATQTKNKMSLKDYLTMGAAANPISLPQVLAQKFLLPKQQNTPIQGVSTAIDERQGIDGGVVRTERPTTNKFDFGMSYAPGREPTAPLAPIGNTQPSSPRIFNGGQGQAPVAEETGYQSKYINPQTGVRYTPDEWSEHVASRMTGGAVPKYAGDQMTQGPQSAEDFARTAREMNNARNDIAVGETDPYGIASQSGIQYTPQELAAIEGAYAGVYDPALQDVFAKLEMKQKQDEEERQARLKAREMEQQQGYDLEQIRLENELDGSSSDSLYSSGEFGSTVDLVSSMEDTVFGKRAASQQLNALIENQDYESAYKFIENAVEKSLTGEPKTKYVNARTDYGVLSNMRNAIQTYAEAGGDMGLLTGTEEQIKRKLGIGSGKESELASYLWREFQTYRNNMTGAAFGAGESRDYASVNPSLGKSLELNLSVIDGALQQLENRIDSTVQQRVPGAKQIKDFSQGKTSSNEMDLSPEEMDEFEAQYGYRPTFSSVGNTSVSGNRPQRNRNPGNVKRGGMADSLAIGVDDQNHLIFPDAETGFKAMEMDLRAKINGQSKWFKTPNPTIAELGKVYAEDPNWAKSVASILGVNPQTRTQTIPLRQLAQAVARQEGFYA